MAHGDGRIFKRGDVYWIAYCAGTPAREVRESSGSRNLNDARKLLRVRLGDKASGRALPTIGRRAAFEDLARLLEADYVAKGRRSLKRALLSLSHLRETFGDFRCEAITSDRIMAYQAARLREGAAAGTVRLELSALKRAFRLARRSGLVQVVPDFEVPAVNNARSGFFEDDDLRRVVEHLPEHLCPVVLFAYFTGWRRSEVVGLRWSHVDIAARVVRLDRSKNGDPRTFPVAAGSELEAVLLAQRDLTRTLERASGRIVPHVFHRAGEPLRDFYGAWRAACRAAGVPGRVFHDLRRTAVRNMERAGVSRSVAMRLCGHRTQSVWARYAVTSEGDLREGVERLASWQSGLRARAAR